MSNDWIKMRASLLTHPKVVRIASALKADNLRTVGGLMSVWCLFDVHSIDGSLDGYTLDVLDEHLRWPGFAAQMVAVHWLCIEPGKLLLPEFDTHNGASAKRRAQDADRKKNVRAASASDADKKRTREREEKEKEEKKKPASAGAGAGGGDVPHGTKPKKAKKPPYDPTTAVLPPWLPFAKWVEWADYRNEIREPLTKRAAEEQLSFLDGLRQAGHDPLEVIKTSIRNQWQGLFAPKSNGAVPTRSKLAVSNSQEESAWQPQPA